MTDLPFASATPEKLKEIIREAELRLAAQLTVAIAADQRAMTFASFLAAADAAVIAALVAISRDNAWSIALIILAVGISIAAVAAIWSAQPVEWDLVGSSPSDWLADDGSVDPDDMHKSMAAMAGYYQDFLAKNDRCIKGGARYMRIALLMLIATLLIGAFVAIAAL